LKDVASSGKGERAVLIGTALDFSLTGNGDEGKVKRLISEEEMTKVFRLRKE